MPRKHFKRLVSRIIWKKTGFNDYVYDFSVDYDATDVDDIVDNHNYLMKKNDNVIKCLDLLKKFFFFVALTIL